MPLRGTSDQHVASAPVALQGRLDLFHLLRQADALEQQARAVRLGGLHLRRHCMQRRPGLLAAGLGSLQALLCCRGSCSPG